MLLWTILHASYRLPRIAMIVFRRREGGKTYCLVVVHVDGDLEPTEIVRELGKVTCDERLGRVGGDLLCTVVDLKL